jgi:hypothetical protein
MVQQGVEKVEPFHQPVMSLCSKYRKGDEDNAKEFSAGNMIRIMLSI